MVGKRISVLVALDGTDEGLKRAITSAERSLGELSTAAKTSGAKAAAGIAEVRAGLSAFGEQVDRAKTQLLAFVTLNWASGKVQEILQVADAWNMMSARLKLATAGQREYAVAQQALFEIAQRIGVPIQETATLYGKLQRAVRMLGAEQKDALTLTESISQALRLSGASATEAQSSLLQFGQALSSGVLRGEEFNSVVENSPRLAQALADGLNVPIGRLRKLAEEGRLTADVVVNALMSQKDKLASEYAQLPATVSQAFTRLSNAFGLWISRLDESTGLTRRLAQAMTLLAENLETVMAWLTRIAEVALGLLIYRLIPALITAWQTAGVAGVTAARATAAAWATVNLTLSGTIARVGALRTAFAVLSAFVVGWEMGGWLSREFEIVRRAGIFMVEVLVRGVEQLRYRWEVFAAIFTGDTIAQATKRHFQRLAEMNQVFAQMYAEATRGSNAAKAAMNTAAATAEEIHQRLQAVRQGTQEALARGLEALQVTLQSLKSRLGEVEQSVGKATQTVNDATAKMAEAYQGLTSIVEANVQRQIEAVKQRYALEQAALTLKTQSETAQITQSSQLLAEALKRQTELRKDATQQAIASVDEEARARQEAARRQGLTEEERRAQVQRVDNEILSTKRLGLTQALADYRQHIDTLNAEANRHLAEVLRIENEKRLLSMTTEERIREIARQAMTEFEANEDRKRQIAQYQEQARAALANGELEHARQLAQKAMDLAAQVGSSQASEARRAHDARQQSEQGFTQVQQLEAQAREANRRQEYASAEQLMRQADALRAELAQKAMAADRQMAQGKQGMAEAIDRIRQSEELLKFTLDAEAKAHLSAASTALNARDEIARTLADTARQIDDITAQLARGLKITLEADATRFHQAIAELDQALAQKAYLLQIQADLQQAQLQLQAFEERLKAGQTLPVDADLTQAKEALDRLKTYAEQHAVVDLKVSTDKAQAAIGNVQNMILALERIQTQSRHTVETNAEAARAEVMSLNGAHTTSTHTVYVRRVETNASGGWVGRTLQRFAGGGAVMPSALPAAASTSRFLAMSGGSVPGSGHQDTVPRTLEAGSFVIRKAAVQRIGAGVLGRLVSAAQAVRYGRAALPRSDTVPAMLTPGEYVVNRAAVARYGVGFFEALNQMRAPAQTWASRLLPQVRGFATGGLVAPWGASGVSMGVPMGVSLPRPDLSTDHTASRSTGRTVRVELALGQRQVTAWIDEREESRLLQLLQAARTRAA